MTDENQGSGVPSLGFFCNDYVCEQVSREAVVNSVVEILCNTALDESGAI